MTNTTEVMSMEEEFDNDCAHTAEVIMGTLVKNENHNAFLLYDINKELFDSSFVAKVARYLGGVHSDEDTITFMGKTIHLSFTSSMVIYGNMEDLEVIINIS